jgi:lipopolysaccharide export system protein LptA
MKIKIKIVFFSIFFSLSAFAENLNIQAKNISLDIDGKTSVFTDEVVIVTKETSIKSDYVKYNKETGFLIIKDNIKAVDKKNNTITAEYAEYYENEKVFKSKGYTKVITSDKYIIEGSDIVIDNKKKIINSKKNSKILDQDKNQIYLENFEYLIEENIFKSIGNIKITDINDNSFEFSQIYINTKKKRSSWYRHKSLYE